MTADTAPPPMPDWSPVDGPWCLKLWIPFGIPSALVDTCLMEAGHGGDCRGINGTWLNPKVALCVGQREARDPNEPKPVTTRVQVPAEFFIEYTDGKVTKMHVSPLESYAGYFGPPSAVVEGDESLDVVDTDGPFWRAVQGALGTVPIGWEE